MRTLKILRTTGPSMAPVISVSITNTAVSDGKPLNCSEIPIAAGAVIDFGAKKTIKTGCAQSKLSN